MMKQCSDQSDTAVSGDAVAQRQPIRLTAMLGCIATLCCTFLAAPVASADDDELPQWLRERLSVGISNRRDNGEMTELVQPITTAIRGSVLQVLCGSRPVALGTVVSTDGYVITKRSELNGDPIRVRLADDRLVSARVAAVRRESDLALLHVESHEDLQPVQWASEAPPVGSFLISSGRGGRPIGIGVVSVSARRVEHQGRLGVVLDDDADGRARVRGVWPDSGADRAGVEPDDRILAINGHRELTRESVIQSLRGMFPGESVRLTIERSGTTLEMDARIREFGVMQESENDAKVNGPRNARLSGFDQVIQHDTVLDPDECGGPVLDSEGRAIGLNIARAGRVVSYALPASLVMPEMLSMLEEARSAAR